MKEMGGEWNALMESQVLVVKPMPRCRLPIGACRRSSCSIVELCPLAVFAHHGVLCKILKSVIVNKILHDFKSFVFGR